jgi:hypothetical protein
VFDESATLGTPVRDPRRALTAFDADLAMMAEVAAAMDPERLPAFDRGWLAVWALLRAFPADTPPPITLGSLGLEGEQWADVIPILYRRGDDARSWVRSRGSAGGLRRLLGEMLEDGDVRRLLHVHDHGGITWFDRDGYRTLGRALTIAGLLGSRSRAVSERASELLAALGRAEDRSGYRVGRLLGLGPDVPPSPRRRAAPG